MKQFNPNVEVPEPKLLELKKTAINLADYDNLRQDPSIEIPDLPQPAAPIPLSEDADVLQGLLNYQQAAKRNYKRKTKKENEVKLLDFVDSSKAIQGSSEEEQTQIKAKPKRENAEPEIQQIDTSRSERRQKRKKDKKKKKDKHQLSDQDYDGVKDEDNPLEERSDYEMVMSGLEDGPPAKKKTDKYLRPRDELEEDIEDLEKSTPQKNKQDKVKSLRGGEADKVGRPRQSKKIDPIAFVLDGNTDQGSPKYAHEKANSSKGIPDTDKEEELEVS